MIEWHRVRYKMFSPSLPLLGYKTRSHQDDELIVKELDFSATYNRESPISQSVETKQLQNDVNQACSMSRSVRNDHLVVCLSSS